MFPALCTSRSVSVNVALVLPQDTICVLSGSLAQPIRVYRPPGTGEEAHRSAGPITGPAMQRWEVRLVRGDGRPGAMAGQTAIDCWRSREPAQEGYRKRLQALRTAGWMAGRSSRSPSPCAPEPASALPAAGDEMLESDDFAAGAA